MQQQNQPSFFEPRTLLAIVAVGLIYFGWQHYLKDKYPQYGQRPAASQTDLEKPKTLAAEVKEQVAEIKATQIEAPTEKIFTFESNSLNFSLSSLGMGLKGVTVNNYVDKEQNKIRLGVSDKENLFEAQLASTGKAIPFDVVEQAPGHYIGKAQIGEMLIKRELIFDQQKNAFTNTVVIEKASDEILKGLVLAIPDQIHIAQSSSFLFPSFEHQDFVIVHDGGTSKTVNFSAAKSDINETVGGTTLLSVGSQYFASAVLDKSDILPEAVLSSSVETKSVVGKLVYKPTQIRDGQTFTQILYAGPKTSEILKSIDAEMPRMIDFGFFDMIARPLAFIMKAFHSLVGNWGFAIILLTLLVRLVVFPFNLMSMRSMKAMQKIQPKLQALRQKYKDDPMALNRETMSLMKESGANPLGGCLPMLIQIPIFFALYKVVGSSVELYQSPFVWWITDLSSHDKFYVLPILMAVSMFLQQKLTPSTMDPMQAKIMMFLPLVFCLFMLQLPSGLTLYMFVSTLFGIVQQYFIMKEKPLEAKA